MGPSPGEASRTRAHASGALAAGFPLPPKISAGTQLEVSVEKEPLLCAGHVEGCEAGLESGSWMCDTSWPFGSALDLSREQGCEGVEEAADSPTEKA